MAQEGRGGVGNRKHRVSGRVPTNRANALAREREANKQIEEKAKAKKRKKSEMKDSIRELY
jgi:hypothetical protein